jgi:hypothetical protein
VVIGSRMTWAIDLSAEIFRHFMDWGFEMERRNACIVIPQIVKVDSAFTLSAWSQSGDHMDGG